MDSSSHPQNEDKGDEIPQNGDKKGEDIDNKEFVNAAESSSISPEDNQSPEKKDGKIEEITNSITDGLLFSTIENQNDPTNDHSNEDIIKDDDTKNENNDDQNNENENNNYENNIENESGEKSNENQVEEEDIKNDDSNNNNEDSILNFNQTFSDEEVRFAFDQMLENGKLPDNSMFPQLLQVIYREKTDAIDNQDYDQAKKLENMITSINRENDIFSLSYSATPESQSRYLEERDSRLHQQLEDTKAKYKVKLDRHSEYCESRLRQLQEKQQQEISELKSKYQDPSFLARFNRPSQQLLNLRRCEKKLALAKKYEEARQIKRIADNKQRQEEKEMQEAAQQSMQSEYVKLIDKQKKDMDRLFQFDKKMEKEIKTAKHKEVSPIEKAIKQTAIRKANNEAKKPFYSLSSSALSYSPSYNPSSQYSLSLSAKNYNPELARDVMAKNQTLATPRTMNKIKMLKMRNKVELNVEPIDNSTFAKLEQMNAKRMKSLLPKL